MGKATGRNNSSLLNTFGSSVQSLPTLANMGFYSQQGFRPKEASAYDIWVRGAEYWWKVGVPSRKAKIMVRPPTGERCVSWGRGSQKAAPHIACQRQPPNLGL